MKSNNSKLKKQDLKNCWGKNKSTKNLPGEKWKPVPGLNDTHKVSNYGRFRCLDKIIYPKNGKRPYLRKGHLMSPTVSMSPNYHAKDFTYHLNINVGFAERNLSFSIRRLVYHCFVEPIELHDGASPEYLIIPKDGNGLNTYYKNLLKVTKSENELLIYHKNRISNTFKLLSKKQRSRMALKGGQKKIKTISQYDKKGNKIATYSSLTEASQKTKILLSTIGNAAKGRIKTAGGFVWQYGNGPRKIKLGNTLIQKMHEHILKTSQPIAQYNLKGKRITIYPSIREASRQTGFNKSTLSACLNGRLRTAYGFMWRKEKNYSNRVLKIKIVSETLCF